MNGQLTMGPQPPEAPDQVLERAKYPVLPEIRPIFDEAHAAQDKIRKDPRYKDSVKADMVREVEDAARVRIDAALERLVSDRGKQFDREEAAIRRELLNPAPSFDIVAGERERLDVVVRLAHKQAAMTAESNALHMVSVAPDAEELGRLFNDAELRGLESVMAAATFRAEALATRERQKDRNSLSPSAAQQIALDMRGRLEKFRTEHPTPSERLRAIAGQREHITAELERSKSYWFRAYGWAVRPTPGASGIVFGSGLMAKG